MRSIMGKGELIISQDKWLLSLVRAKNSIHAFLILEGVTEANEREVMKAELLFEPEDKKKGRVVCDPVSIKRLEERMKEDAFCFYTWRLSLEQAREFKAKIETEKQREIVYVTFGNSAMNGFFSASASKAVASNDASFERLSSAGDTMGGVAWASHASVDMLLREGVNCVDWAIELVKSLNLPTPKEWKAFCIVHPHDILPDPSKAGCNIM
ncbi:MAG: hypothetical protein K2Q14_06600 [Gammaproteobacteria bacterium]|nr:hypothetical protein [Gammaproteobacteria bacterium]